MHIPLSFNSSSSPSSSSTQVLTSWGLSSSDDDLAGGALTGLQDGSILLLRPSLDLSEKQAKIPGALPSPAALSRASLATATSRSNSPAGSHVSPFSVTPRSRIVSGVNTEQVEAPKTYVDFDDEAEKLKDMLSGRPGHNHRGGSFDLHRERPTVIDDTLLHETNIPSAKRRKDAPSSISSTAASPAPTPPLISPYLRDPTKTTASRDQDLKVVCHIIPPSVGRLNPVAKIELLYHNEVSVVLHESGQLAILSNRDGECFDDFQLANTDISSDGTKSSVFIRYEWIWTHLRSYIAGESILLLASAAVFPESVPSTSNPEDSVRDGCRVVLLEVQTSHLVGNLEMKLAPIGQWFYDGLPQASGLQYMGDHSCVFYFVGVDGKFTMQRVHILSRPLDVPTPPKDARESQVNLGVLGPVPNLFKSKPKSFDAEIPALKSGRVQLEDISVIGHITSQSPLVDYHFTSIRDEIYGVGWSENELIAFCYGAGAISILFSYPIANVYQAQWLYGNDTIGVALEGRCELYKIVAVDASGDETILLHPRLSKTISIDPYVAIEFISLSELLIIDCDQNLLKHSWDGRREHQPSVQDAAQTIWSRSEGSIGPANFPQVTVTMTLSMEMIILGYSDGLIRRSSFLKLWEGKVSPSDSAVCSDLPLTGSVVSLHVVTNHRINVQFIVGGGDDGSIAIWTMNLKVCARWTIFTTSLHRIGQFPDIKGRPLRDVILFVAQDGTIAMVALDGFQFLYVVPGSPSPLQRVFLGEDNLFLAYANQRARLWGIHTMEFWRSMTMDKAEEVIAQGGWSEIIIRAYQPPLNLPVRNIADGNYDLNTACTLSLDLNAFLSDSLLIIKTLSTNRKQTRDIFLAREHLQSILSLLVTPGLNEGVDDICYEKLGVKRTNSSAGFLRNGFISLYHCPRPEHHWSLSGHVSAARALAIVAVLRALSIFEEISESAATVIAFYATGLSEAVGPTYKPLSLAFLAQRWFENSSRRNAPVHIDLTLGAHLPLPDELRHSARLLFDAAIVRLSDEQTNAIVDEWQHQLPCLQPTADKESTLAALALFLCGYLAADKYSMLPANALIDIARSITLYLHDEHSVHRVLAIDLCSRGFHVWQHYIDALEILRSLFSLATNFRKESINAQNVGAQARIAVLHLASNHTPLFMTTLGLDILNPISTEHRKSVMQIVAFLIKKRPLVLYPNLPKLMEAVVKSLDPNSTSNRDAVLDTVTEILGHVVKTFPNVDFHMASQRLAVGTSEGAMVMYDLKTAIRLYVLEGHKKRIAACSFSPDGRRLVTLSLEEGVVLVWKVGSSFVSFFNPGAPPRQGHSGSDPFKTLPFNVGHAGNMTIADTLQLVDFEWTAERSVKLKIRDSILTFST